ncbi:type IV secretion system protein VirB10 [uncultured Caulobacter sp.]|uniref:type IV secretion system protein VirB10 n=1 Tax=uncultured Caulobacter sp. TaxID=158749 RepID=UPI00261E5704|nr:type IV secretion system protein VirB10 [uncultured Caulobacter sp.]
MRASDKPADGDLDSPVLDRLAYEPTAVSRRDSPWGPALAMVAIVIVAFAVYTSLSHARETRANRRAPTAYPAASSPPAASTMPPPAVATGEMAQALPPATAPVPAAPGVAAMEATTPQDATSRLHAPAMVVDLVDAPAAGGAIEAPMAQAAAKPAAARPAGADDAKMSAEERFAEKVSGGTADTARASHLGDPSLIATQGTVIPAILETAINSDLPGFVRAVVSRDVRGFDGTTVLIPRGSKLIGQYKSGVAAGQSRAFVVWSRVITPEGVSIDIGSPGGDRLGRGGLDGETNTHFFRRFGASIMLSVLNAGLQAAANGRDNGNTAIIIGSPQQATNIASIALQREIDIPTTISVAQGTPIRVFIARDLDFSGVTRKTP